jgi:hypothetical protein
VRQRGSTLCQSTGVNVVRCGDWGGCCEQRLLSVKCYELPCVGQRSVVRDKVICLCCVVKR